MNPDDVLANHLAHTQKTPPTDAKRKAGRNARRKGNDYERQVAHELGFRRVGQYGGPEDVAGDAFTVQVKCGNGYFSERYWRYLEALPQRADKERVLVVADSPGPGHRRRAIVVQMLDEWKDARLSREDEP